MSAPVLISKRPAKKGIKPIKKVEDEEIKQKIYFLNNINTKMALLQSKLAELSD